MLDLQAEELVIRTRDLQLLHVTKEMQEFLRSGDENAQAAEILSLDKNAEYNDIAQKHRIKGKNDIIDKTNRLIQQKRNENSKLDEQLLALETSFGDRKRIYEMTRSKNDNTEAQKATKDVFIRRRLVDLSKSQTQDLVVLREEVQRLRLRTYPNLAG